MTLAEHGHDKAADTWTRILVGSAVLLIGVITWGVYLTIRILSAPVSPRSPEAIELAVEEEEPEYIEPVEPVPAVVAVPRPAPTVAPPVAEEKPIVGLELPPGELQKHLAAQTEIMYRQLRENEGNDNGLTPSAEEIEMMRREGRMVF